MGIASVGDPIDQPARLPGLDGLRGVAIILVMLFHLAFFAPACGLDRLFYKVTQYGWAGVDLFFVLSGFLITGILIDAKGAPGYFKNFYIRRALRILPLYYLFLAGLLVFYPRVNAHFAAEAAVLWDHQWWLWTHMTNWLVATSGSFHHPTTLGTGGFWSLAIEEQYYLFWPVVVLLLSRRQLFWTCLGLILFSISLRMVMLKAGYSWATLYSATFIRFDPFAVGGALAIVSRSSRGLDFLRPWAWGLGLVALLGLAALEKQWLLRLLDAGYQDGRARLAGQLTILPVLWGSAMILTLTASPASLIARTMQTSILRTFGKYSYALYLFHGHLVILPSGLATEWLRFKHVPTIFGSVLPLQFVYLAVTFSICLGVAWLSWNLLENPFLKLKKYFPSGQAAPPRQRSAQVASPARARAATADSDGPPAVEMPLPVGLSIVRTAPDREDIMTNAAGSRSYVSR